MITTEIESVIQKLNKDLRAAAVTLSPNEARYLVDAYYTVQDYRKTTANQFRELSRAGEPNELIAWLLLQHEALENQIKKALDIWTGTQKIGEWSRSIIGIGPVISAGLMAHIDITKAPTVSHIWSFAGLNPDAIWEKGQKRPWNANLKTLCWKIGESFMKVSTNKNDVYGKVYAKRRQLEWSHNLNGDFAEQAKAMLGRKNFDKKTQAYKWYSGQYDPATVRQFLEEGKSLQDLPEAPTVQTEVINHITDEDGITTSRPLIISAGVRMLPPDHILQRSKRYAVKLFLAHYHEVAYKLHYGEEPPAPYPIKFMDHDPTSYIPAPNQEIL